MSRAGLRSATLALAAAALLAAACRRPAARDGGFRASPGAPVFLIVVDTLRSDRLPFYGYASGVTPALSALREDSILFESAW
ncbi:MAG TPA: hypothetical protein PK569_21055, partial [Thermoanaerobaculia bacterium]|nr:hypothetical protein [Thermoanaerobaculia bacterium]